MVGAAAELLGLAMSDPQGLIDLVATRPPATAPADQVGEKRALGVSLRRVQRLEDSANELTEALSLAESAAPELWAECALSLAVTWLFQGQAADGLALLDKAVERSTGAVQAEALYQLGSTHGHFTGDLHKARWCFEQALPIARAHSETELTAQILQNRGIVSYYLGDYESASANMEEAIELHHETADRFGLAETTNNLALVRFRQGEVAESLRLFDQIRDELTAVGVPEEAVLNDRIEVLLAAGLFEEALDAARRASTFFDDAGNVALNLVAIGFGIDAAMASDLPELAAGLADNALGLPGADAFDALRAKCLIGRLAAQTRLGTVQPDDLDSVTATAERMDSGGFHDLAFEARVTASSALIDSADWQTASGLLGSDHMIEHQGSIALQLQMWELTARLCKADNDHAGVLRAVDAGLGAASEHLASESNYELRVHAGRHTAALTELGVDVLVATDRLADARQMIEQARSDALRWVPAPSQALGQLRSALRELRQLESNPDPTTGRRDQPEQVAALRRTVAELSRQRYATSVERGSQALLDGAMLLTLAVVGGQVLCICERSDATATLRRVDLDSVTVLLQEHAAVERQLARRAGLSPRALSALLADHQALSVALEVELIGDTPPERLIINPDPRLGPVSWGALPGLREAPFTVAAAHDLARQTITSRSDAVVAIGGGTLAHVPPELEQVAAIHAAAGGAARAICDPTEDPLEAIDGSHLLHAAGHFRVDGSNPMFSAIDLGTGDLRGYDLLALEAPPLLAVLSACSTAATASVGVASYGFATALLAGGSKSIVASSAPIEDGHALTQMMVALHRELASGRDPADALASLRTNCAPEDLPLIGSFSTLGSGWALR